MITPSTIYWATRFDAFNALVFVPLIISGVLAAFTGFPLLVETLLVESDDPLVKRLWRFFLGAVSAFLMLLAVFTFIPTTKEVAAMYVIPAVANSEKVHTAGNRLYDLAVEWMDGIRPERVKKPADDKD